MDDDALEFAISEIKRMLKPGGMLVITTPNEEKLANNIVVCPECECYFHRVQHVQSWSKVTLAAYLRQYGLEYVKSKELNLRSEPSLIKSIYALVEPLILKMLRRKPRNLILVAKKEV